MDTLKIFNDLVEMGYNVVVVESVNKQIVLDGDYTDVSEIEAYLEFNEIEAKIVVVGKGIVGGWQKPIEEEML